MANCGYIRIPRSLLQDPLWKKLTPFHKEVFLTLLEHVCYFPQKFDDHGIIIDLLPGQFCASYREILALCGDDISKNHVERGIVKLEKCRFLRQEVRHIKTIITITHIDTYGLIIRSCETTNETKLRQSRDTNKESKKQKKEKEQQQRPSAVVVFPCLEKISEELVKRSQKINVSKNYSETIVKDAIEVITHPDFVPQQSFSKSLNAACRGEWKPNLQKEDHKKINKEYAKSVEKSYKGPYKIEVLSKNIEIVIGSNSAPKVFSYELTHEKFKKSVNEILKIPKS